MTQLKLPDSFYKIINSSDHKEPVAFLDVWEERGDYSIIDTQNQFHAYLDNAIINDLNVDFDRKPGSAVLSAGKHVDSTSTVEVPFLWGEGLLDWSLLGNPNLTTGSASSYTIGVGSVGSNFVGIQFGKFGTSTLNRAVVVSSTDNAKSFNAESFLVGNGTHFFDYSNAVSASANDNFTNFDNIFAVAGKPSGGFAIEFINNSTQIPFIHQNPSSYSNPRRVSCAKISGNYFIGYKFLDGTNGGILIENKISNTRQIITFSGSSRYVSSISTRNNIIYAVVVNTDQSVEIHTSPNSTVGSFNFTLLKTIPVPIGWTSGAFYLRFVNDNMIMLNATSGFTEYLLSIDGGLNFSIKTIAFKIQKVSTASFDQSSVIVSDQLKGGLYETKDGINWLKIQNISYTTSANQVSSYFRGPMPFSSLSGTKGCVRFDKFYSNSFYVSTTIPASSFEYKVKVIDRYTIDTSNSSWISRI